MREIRCVGPQWTVSDCYYAMAAIEGLVVLGWIKRNPTELFLVWICLLLFTSRTSSETPHHAVVDTKAGKIKGVVTGGDPITQFLGIPYAQAPIGKLRFRVPQRHPGWAFGGVLDATTKKADCPQDDNIINSSLSEDCLYLDVFVPRNLSKLEHINTLSLPVVFYVSGENFQTVDTSVDVEELVKRGDVIVTRVQYRVGVLGFLSLANTSSPGNAGLWDQRMALHWVWDNIREFGGNPEAITLMGDSAGGVSVGYHILSPRSRGFFTRAVSQSGNMASPRYLQRHPARAAVKLARLCECEFWTDPQAVVDCLQGLTLASLLQAARELDKTTTSITWLPVVDRDFLPDSPLRLLKEGSLNPVDYLLGIGTLDGLTLVKERHLASTTSLTDFEEVVQSGLEEFYGISSQRLFMATLLEYSTCSSNMSELLVSFFSDIAFVAPVHLAARAMAEKNKKVYVYQFSEEGDPSSEERLPAMAEVPVLGRHLADTAVEEELQERVRTAWINFLLSGDPNPFNQMGLYWKAFRRDTPRYLQLGIHMDRGSLRPGFSARRMAFWNDYVPTLLDWDSEECSVAKDVCSHEIRDLEEEQLTTSTAMWALSGACLLLLLLVVILGAKLWVPKTVWRHCKPRARPVPVHENETRKLQPLPYYDE